MRSCLLLFWLTLTFAGKVRYDGYQVLQVTVKHRSQLETLIKLHETDPELDFWTEPRTSRPIDIMVPPHRFDDIVDLITSKDMDYTIKIDDVQKLIDQNQQAKSLFLFPRSTNAVTQRNKLNWTSYARLDAIYEFMNDLAATFPDLVTVTSQGKSYEDRDILMMKISSGGTGKHAIFIDGGIHAREWLSPAFVTWLINELVVNNTVHPQYTENLDWYFMPVVNPDGYEYSHSVSRMWRKNRRPNSCGIGADINRNFGFHWNEGGSSRDGCLETYHGEEAFSEPESKVLRDTLLSIANQTKCYMTFHAYGQYWLTPWGFTADLPDDYDDLFSLSLNATEALKKVYGTTYTTGSSTNALYIASGGSDDWAKGVAGIKYSYTVELRDLGTFGFELPTEQIIPTAVETWEGVKVIADAIINTSTDPSEAIQF